MESGIKKFVLSYLVQYKIINNSQHGFLSRKSTTTQLLECCLDWNIALNSHSCLDVIYLDYAKAFDSVVRSKLLAKLACYGINNILLTWIKNFLSGRTQFVKIAGMCSTACSVISGVPQGSVLGPVLFILYVNDICNLVPNCVTIKLFADDTKLYSVINDSTTADCLQSCLTAISEWSDHWQLKLSPSKCTVLHVSLPKTRTASNVAYRISGHTLPTVDSVTDLGIKYNSKLRFWPHVDSIVSKAALRSKLILKCFYSRDPSLLVKAFCTFVRPILEYCCVIWNPMFQYEIKKIEAVQRRFTKKLRGLHNLPYSSRLTRLGLDSLHTRRVKCDLIMCYKILNGLVCVDSDTFFTRSNTCHTRGNSVKLNKSHTISARDGNFFPNRVINAWNSLPDVVVLSSSVASFKRKLDKINLML